MDTQAPAPASAPSLADFLASVEPLSLFSREELDRLAAQVETRSYAFGDTLCKRGEPAAGLYVIRSGSVRIIAEERGKEMSLGVRKEREVFGEIAMLRDYWHEVSVRASAKTEVLCIPRAALEPLLVANPAAQSFVTSYVAISSAGGFVTRLFDLRGKLSRAELEEYVSSVGVKRVSAGKEIIHQGAGGDMRLYVVRQGEVSIAREEDGTVYQIAKLGAGSILTPKGYVGFVFLFFILASVSS